MSVVLPQSPRQLRWMLARKLGATALAISIMAGGAAYLAETRRAEQAALERAADGARHFQTPAMQMAIAAKNHSIWYVASEHLIGNAHAAANQINENAKRFAGYFTLPELNHHLLEGMKYPQNNPDSLLFIFLESKLYDKRIQKRYAITKEVLKKNMIPFLTYTCDEKTPFGQAAEVLVMGSYLSFYLAVLEGIDPTAIPFVDYFKSEMKK